MPETQAEKKDCFWQLKSPGTTALAQPASVKIDNLCKWVNEYKNGKYIDTHAWYFTPEAFKEIMSKLNEIGLVKLKVSDVYETEKDSCNFFAILEKK